MPPYQQGRPKLEVAAPQEKLPPRLLNWPPPKVYRDRPHRSGQHPVLLFIWSLLAFACYFCLKHLRGGN